jgi:hypothetical protein
MTLLPPTLRTMGSLIVAPIGILLTINGNAKEANIVVNSLRVKSYN